jgi:hypothetical protein
MAAKLLSSYESTVCMFFHTAINGIIVLFTICYENHKLTCMFFHTLFVERLKQPDTGIALFPWQYNLQLHPINCLTLLYYF